MAESSFVGYIGDADFHDGHVIGVEQHSSTVNVRVRGASGQVYLVEFTGVLTMRAARPEGMMLYALSEFSGKLPMRRFVFVNWDDDSEAYLEVDAEAITIHRE